MLRDAGQRGWQEREHSSPKKTSSLCGMAEALQPGRSITNLSQRREGLSPHRPDVSPELSGGEPHRQRINARLREGPSE